MRTNGTTSSHGHDRAAARRFGDGVGAETEVSPHLPHHGNTLELGEMKVCPHSDDALRMELYRRFESAMRGCKNFTVSENAFAPTPPKIPTPLAETLKDPETRSCAWRYFETIGIDSAFSATERRALCVGLLSYVNEDRTTCVDPLIEMALYASEHRDMPLYKAVGEVARATGLGNVIAAATVSGFCELSSYNAQRESAFHPWIDILARSDSEPVYAQIADSLNSRIRARQAGTYDHLLRTLCQAPSRHAATLLRSMVAVSYPPIADEVPKPRSLTVGLSTATQLCLVVVTVHSLFQAAAAFERSEEIGMALKTVLISPTVWSFGASVGALCGLALVGWMWEDRRQAIELFDGIRQNLKGLDYLHFAERVYGRLGESAACNPYAEPLRAYMEHSEVHASVIGTWKKRYPLNDTKTESPQSAAHGRS